MATFDQQLRLPTLSGADYVHDIAYDYYGTRLALCTSSLKICIYSAPPQADSVADANAAWVETARIDRAHSGPIWRLSWGHPEHGEPLASCSEDRTINIWVTTVRPETASSWPANAIGATTGAGAIGAPARPWARRAQLQHEGPVVDVKFGPSATGLKVAACTANGKTKLWECVNSQDLRQWDAEDLETLVSKLSTLSTGLAPPAGPAGAAGATAVGDGPTVTTSGCSSASLDWMPVPFGGGKSERSEAIALGGPGGRLAIWATERNGRWREMASAEAHTISAGGVKDVAWCPNLCRQYEIIATCGAGAKLWRVDFVGPSEERYDGGLAGLGGGYRRKEHGNSCQLRVLRELVTPSEEICPVWRCSWSLTGTVLALSPEGAEVSLWKAGPNNEWRQECDIDLNPAEES